MRDFVRALASALLGASGNGRLDAPEDRQLGANTVPGPPVTADLGGYRPGRDRAWGPAEAGRSETARRDGFTPPGVPCPPVVGPSGSSSVVVSLAAVLGSYAAVRSGAGDRLDRTAHRLLTRDRGAVVDRVVAVLTDLGSVYALAGAATSCALAGRRRLAVDLAAAGSVAWLGAQATKPLLDRPRPYELATAARLVAVPAGSSWPSGHAALSAAMADAFAHRSGRSVRIGLVMATGAVGASRCYVGVHHLTDVVAGWGVGVLASRLARRLTSPVPAAASVPTDVAGDPAAATSRTDVAGDRGGQRA